MKTMNGGFAMKGSIEWRGKHKDQARLIVSVGLNAKGQAVKKYRTLGTVSNKDAEIALAKFITEIETGTLAETKKMTLFTFVELWLKNYVEVELRPKTAYRYKQILYARILPELGHITMTKINPLMLAAFYRGMQQPNSRLDGKKGGLSKTTVLHHHRLLHSIFEVAVKWQVIASNPASRVSTPKAPKLEAGFYNESQIKDLLTALEKEHYQYQVIVIMAIDTGMRESELMGLTWANVDLEKRIVKVVQTRHYIPKIGHIINPPKTDHSHRKIALSITVANLLFCLYEYQQELKRKNESTWKDSGFVFVSKYDGAPIHSDTMTHWFPRFLRKHGLPHLRFHGLRHTSATLLNSKGLDIASISRRLGHSTKMTTLNIYTHAFSNTDHVASQLIEEVIAKPNVK